MGARSADAGGCTVSLLAEGGAPAAPWLCKRPERNSSAITTAVAPANALQDLPSIFRSSTRSPARRTKRRCNSLSSLRVIVASALSEAVLALREPASRRMLACTSSSCGHSPGADHTRSTGSRSCADARVDEEMPSKHATTGANGPRVPAWPVKAWADRNVIHVKGGGRGRERVG